MKMIVYDSILEIIGINTQVIREMNFNIRYLGRNKPGNIQRKELKEGKIGKQYN